MNTFVINNSEISFKEFLSKIHQQSGLSKNDFYKHKIILQIPDMEIYNLIKNNPKIYFSNPIYIKTNEDLKKSNAMLPILDSNVYYETRKNADFTYILEKRTEQELDDLTYRQTLDEVDENLVNIDAELNEFYSKTNITQYYFNHFNNPVELILKLPFISSIQFSKFTLDINGKIVVSKILEKEKAKEKYNDAIASGKTGAISSKEGNYIKVNIGNIEPKSFVKLTTEFIQFLTSEDMSYCYSMIKTFPVLDIKNNTNDDNDVIIKQLKNVKVKINIKTHSKISRLITQGLTQNKSQKFNDDYTQCFIEYFLSEKDIIKEYSDSDSDKEENIQKNNNNDKFKILFRTEKMNIFNLITQYDPIKDETSCILSMLYNRDDINIPKNKKPDLDNKNNYIDIFQKNLINSYPSLFIFLIDQSGSMDGEPINIVKETLLFFLQSLPKNSYYQLIGFGSTMVYISSEEPSEYTVENVTKTIKKIKRLKADLGGTQLLEPLKHIFNNKNFDNLNLCKNLFILTDGEVWDGQQSLKLIKDNLNSFRVHSFGIGDSFDKKFIKESGKNGSYCFIPNINNIKLNVIQTLNKTLRNYLYDCKISVKNIETKYNFFTKQKIFYQDEFINYYFIIKNKIDNCIIIQIKYFDKQDYIIKELYFDKENKITENDGDIISKIIIGNILNNTELNEETNIELSKKYQVLSKYTSLYAEMENDKEIKNEMIPIEQKNIEESIINKNNIDISRLKKRCKYKKCKRRICYDEESDDSDSDSDSSSSSSCKKKKCKKKCKKKRKRISHDSDSDSDSFLDNDKKCRMEISDKEDKPEKLKPEYSDKEMILTQNILEGNWTINFQTQFLIDSNKDIYNKIKQYVEKINVGENKENIIITILVLYYLKNNVRINKDEYILIINKGIQYLQNLGVKELLYENVESNIK